MSDMQHNHLSNLQSQARAGPPIQDERATASALLPTITMAEVTTLLDFSPDALVMIDAAGTIVLLNEQATTLFGYGHHELNGHPLEVLLPERFHAVYVRHRLTYLRTPRPRPMEAGLDLVGRRKDGSEFPLDISLRPVLLGQVLHVMGAIRDGTPQRQRERERFHQMERLVVQSTLIHLAHDAILVRDQMNRVLCWNRGSERSEDMGCLRVALGPHSPLIYGFVTVATYEAVSNREGER